MQVNRRGSDREVRGHKRKCHYLPSACIRQAVRQKRALHLISRLARGHSQSNPERRQEMQPSILARRLQERRCLDSCTVTAIEKHERAFKAGQGACRNPWNQREIYPNQQPIAHAAEDLDPTLRLSLALTLRSR